MKYQVSRFLSLIFKSDLLLPVILLLAYLGLWLIVKGVFLTPEEMINDFSRLYKNYGYEIIFIAAFLESLVVINLFMPGMFALAMGIIFAKTGQTSLPLVIFFSFLGSFCGYTLDYFIGKFGFGDIFKRFNLDSIITQTKKKLNRLGTKGLILGYLHTNLASFVSLAAGIMQIPPRFFFLIMPLASLFWLTALSLMIYAMGDIVLELFRRYLFIIVLLILTGMVLLSLWQKREKDVST